MSNAGRGCGGDLEASVRGRELQIHRRESVENELKRDRKQLQVNGILCTVVYVADIKENKSQFLSLISGLTCCTVVQAESWHF